MKQSTLRYLALAALVALLPLGVETQAQEAKDKRHENINEVSTPAGPGTPAPPNTPIWVRGGSVLWDNGPLLTSSGTGAGGADESVLENVAIGNTTLGSAHSVSSGFRGADDFTVPASGWGIETITFFAYQTGSSTTSPITAVNLRIWDGVPDMPGSSVVFGDTTTNLLDSTSWTNIYRVAETTPGDSLRPIMANIVDLGGLALGPGTYWLDWQTDGSTSFSGPWAPPVTIPGMGSTGDAYQTDNTGTNYAPLLDGGTGNPQGMPFIIEGTGSPVELMEFTAE